MTSPPAPHPRNATASSRSGHVGAMDAAISPMLKTSAHSINRRPVPRRERVNPSPAMPTHSPRKCAVTISPAVPTLIPNREAICGIEGP